MKIIILVFALMRLALYAWAQADMEIARDTVYGVSDTGKALTMIVVEQKDGKDFKPACIAIHGGAWMGGSANDFMGQASFMARQGFKVFNIDYRLLPEAKMHQQIADCRTAVRHVRANAKHYGIDPNRIIAMGHSAGGHLACMLAVLRPGVWEGAGLKDVSSQIQGVVNWCGPEELVKYYTPDSQFTDLFKGLAEDPEGDPIRELEKMSPITYVRRGMCPILSIHGGRDDIVPAVQGTDFHKRLDALGVRNKLVILPEEDHGLGVHPEDTIKLVEEFSRDFMENKGLFAPAVPAKKD
ncbi:MAG: alpha/beta hydrolase [Abditibacteriota bacterium]|nr:alpha/beta hydrolase [Abditibacteriota bacterium]